MPNPFPGMNPYLEQPDFWSDFHNQLVASLARVLVPELLPKYRVVMDKWVYKVGGGAAIAIGRPDVAVQQSRTQPSIVQSAARAAQVTIQPIQVIVPLLEEVRQAYLEVRDSATQAVVTTIEVLSPANKRGEGRKKYETKRQQVLESLTNWVEIDLLRDGEALPLGEQDFSSHYRILVSRANARPIADLADLLYGFNLGDRVPAFPLPLQPEDAEPIVDVQQLINDLCEQLGYDYFIDYCSTPPPPWSETDIAAILHQRS